MAPRRQEHYLFGPMRIPGSSLLVPLFLFVAATVTACGNKATPEPQAAKPAASAPAKQEAPKTDAAKPAQPAAVEKEEKPSPTTKPTAVPDTDGLVAVAKNPDGTIAKIQTKATKPVSGKGPNAAVLAAIDALMAKPEQADASIEVQHCLIAFQNSGTGATRSKEDAESLAHQLFLQAIGGADFDKLVKDNTDDSHPGIYGMDATSRKGMVQAFGDVGWRLKVGEIGLAPFDAKKSPFGWHLIKRIK